MSECSVDPWGYNFGNSYERVRQNFISNKYFRIFIDQITFRAHVCHPEKIKVKCGVYHLQSFEPETKDKIIGQSISLILYY